MPKLLYLKSLKRNHGCFSQTLHPSKSPQKKINSLKTLHEETRRLAARRTGQTGTKTSRYLLGVTDLLMPAQWVLRLIRTGYEQQKQIQRSKWCAQRKQWCHSKHPQEPPPPSRSTRGPNNPNPRVSGPIPQRLRGWLSTFRSDEPNPAIQNNAAEQVASGRASCPNDK